MRIEVGYHASLKKGFASSVKFHHETYGVRAFQMFAKAPQGWRLSKYGEEPFMRDLAACRAYVETHGIFLVIHMGYMINGANPIEAPGKSTLAMAVDDMRVAEAMGACGVVYHVGKSLKRPVEECLDVWEQFVRSVLAETSTGLFIIETAAGQGSEMCVRMEEFGAFLARFADEPRVRVCLDTCHVFAAGYDLTTTNAVDEFYALFDDCVGWDKVAVVHLNDSKGATGCCKDRHENLGAGHIGEAGLSHLARKMFCPLILETPVSSKKRLDDPSAEESEIEMVRRWLEEK